MGWQAAFLSVVLGLEQQLLGLEADDTTVGGGFIYAGEHEYDGGLCVRCLI